MGKQPSFQFYPGDWKRDAGVQSLSFEERGVWFEMLLLMFESVERGKLVFATGIPMSEDAVSRSLGLDRQRYVQILRRLLQYGVASKEKETGIIYCRRMVRDAKLSETRKKCGKKGGNPNLVNQNSTKKIFKVKQIDNQNPTPSSSYSSSDNINPLLPSGSCPPCEGESPPPKGENASFDSSIPTLSEVLEYAAMPDVAVLTEEAERFYYRRAEERWRDRFGRIIDWRASLRGWKSNPFYGQKIQKSKEHCEKSNDRNAGTLNDPAKYDIDGNWKPSY